MPLERDEKGNLIVVAGASIEDSDWIKQIPGARESDNKAHEEALEIEKKRQEDLNDNTANGDKRKRKRSE